MTTHDWQRFVLDYGYRVPVAELSAITGVDAAAIRRLRATGAVAARTQRLPYGAMFAAWHGHAPGEDDYPPLSRAGGGYAWDASELVLLARLNGRVGVRDIAALLTSRLRARTGDLRAERSAVSVQVNLGRIGLQAGDLVGGLTVPEAAAEIGSEAIVRDAIERGQLAAERVAHRVLIPYAAWEAWKVARNTPPPGYVRLSSIRARLGIASDKLSEFARAGYVPGAVATLGANGGHGLWYIAPEAAERLVADRQAGRPMPWHGKPMECNLKQVYGRWSARRHPDTCSDCDRIWGEQGVPSSFDTFAERYPVLTMADKRHLTRQALRTTGAGAAAGEAQRRYTLREVAAMFAVSLSWVRAHIDAGTVKVVAGPKNARMLTEAMVARLRQAWIRGDELPLGPDWLLARAAAREAGVCVATLSEWGNAGDLERRNSATGWRYQREAVRARARRYWKQVRFKRAAPPAWLVEEQAARAATA